MSIIDAVLPVPGWAHREHANSAQKAPAPSTAEATVLTTQIVDYINYYFSNVASSAYAEW